MGEQGGGGRGGEGAQKFQTDGLWGEVGLKRPGSGLVGVRLLYETGNLGEGGSLGMPPHPELSVRSVARDPGDKRERCGVMSFVMRDLCQGHRRLLINNNQSQANNN